MIMYRKAMIHDLERIVDIYNSTIPSRKVTADLEPVSVDSRLPWLTEHINLKNRPLWVIESEDQVVGWVSLSSFYGRPAYQHTAEVSIYLDATFRGKGIGKQTLSFIIEQCPTLEIKTLIGFIFGHNESSLNLFLKFGFEKWGTLPGVAELDGVERDLVIVGKRMA